MAQEVEILPRERQGALYLPQLSRVAWRLVDELNSPALLFSQIFTIKY